MGGLLDAANPAALISIGLQHVGRVELQYLSHDR